MKLKKLNRKIIKDESEEGRLDLLWEVYRKLEKTKGFCRQKLGETKFGPVHVYHQEEMWEGKKDVLLLGGMHPLCEAASVASVIYTMRHPPDCNLSAVPVTSPWAFVAPITDMEEVEREHSGNTSSYRVAKYHYNFMPTKRKGKQGIFRDINRLRNLNGNRYDLVVECHMDYDDDANPTYKPTKRVGMMVCKKMGNGFVKTLKKITREFKKDGVLIDPVDRQWEILGTEFLLKNGGKTVIFETDPNDVTLFKRFVDKLIAHTS